MISFSLFQHAISVLSLNNSLMQNQSKLTKPKALSNHPKTNFLENSYFTEIYVNEAPKPAITQMRYKIEFTEGNEYRPVSELREIGLLQ